MLLSVLLMHKSNNLFYTFLQTKTWTHGSRYCQLCFSGDDPKIVSHYDGVLMCLIFWDIRFQSATIRVRILRQGLVTLDLQ